MALVYSAVCGREAVLRWLCPALPLTSTECQTELISRPHSVPLDWDGDCAEWNKDSLKMHVHVTHGVHSTTYPSPSHRNIHMYSMYMLLSPFLIKAVSSFTISLSFSNASVLYTYFPCKSSLGCTTGLSYGMWHLTCLWLVLLGNRNATCM